jgi:hypothetical protein
MCMVLIKRIDLNIELIKRVFWCFIIDKYTTLKTNLLLGILINCKKHNFVLLDIFQKHIFLNVRKTSLQYLASKPVILRLNHI